MDATFLKADGSGLVHYYCDHHAPVEATRIGTAPSSATGLKKFLPLIVIFSSIILFTIITSIIHGQLDAPFSMRMMMGSFFLIFSLFKIFNIQAFADAYGTYDVVAKRSRVYAFVYPFLELLLAVLYLANLGGIARDVFTFILMTVSTIGVVQKIREKEEVPCACLGMVFKVPMTWVTLIEDVLMALEALFMILMTIGKPLAYAATTPILVETLKIHPTAEWVKFSVTGHQAIGVFLLVVVIASIIERKSWKIQKVFSKYIVPILFVGLGLSLSVVDITYHAIVDDPQAVWYLLTHWSQFGQHFLGGLLFMTAGVAEWIHSRKNIFWISLVTPSVVLVTGIIFFFHQQLGVVPSVIYSMTWHMLFGASMVISATFRIIDLLLFKEKKGFFIVWIIALLIGAGMMITYREPPGAYELPAITDSRI